MFFKEGRQMSWPTLVIASVALIVFAAVLLRHPGVVLYDWFAARRVARIATRTAARIAATRATGAPRATAHAAKRVEPAPSIS